jgi:hypothetical protein
MLQDCKSPNCLPHHSILLRNKTRGNQIIKLSDSDQQYATLGGTMGDWENNWANMPDVKCNVILSGETDKSYIVRPGKAIKFIFEGGIVPPEDFEEDLLLAVHRPKYGLEVPCFSTFINFDYADVAADGDRTKPGPLVKWSNVHFSIHSPYTKQRVPCSFDYKVTVSEDEEEQQRCCLIHLPQYNQDTFLYYPHDFSRRTGRRTCECCE